MINKPQKVNSTLIFINDYLFYECLNARTEKVNKQRSIIYMN